MLPSFHSAFSRSTHPATMIHKNISSFQFAKLELYQEVMAIAKIQQGQPLFSHSH